MIATNAIVVVCGVDRDVVVDIVIEIVVSVRGRTKRRERAEKKRILIK